VKRTGRIPVTCFDCSKRGRTQQHRLQRFAREDALPAGDGDLECKRCARPITGSSSEDPATRRQSHIVHFETYHSAESNRRDKDRYKRAIQKGSRPVEMVREVDVFRRDNYECQICHETILVNESPGHRLGPSIDHIEWLSRGGSHTISNVRATHLGCNIRQGWAVHRQRVSRARRRDAAQYRAWERRREQRRDNLIGCLGWTLTIIAILTLLNWLS